MNFLFGALLIILVLLPGSTFRLSYLEVPYKKANPSTTFLEKVLGSIFISFILQIPSYLITNYFIRGIDETKLFLVFINSDKVLEKSPFYAEEIGLFFLFIMTVCSIAALLGWLGRKLVIAKKWDLKFSVLKIYSDWYDFFEGRILDYPNQPGEGDREYERWIDVLLENNDGCFIYSGLLREFVLSHDGKLEKIYLTGVMRRKLTDDRPIHSKKRQKKENYYFMPGDFFLIPGDKIINVNITYYEASEKRE